MYQKHYYNLCILEQFFFLNIRIWKMKENLSCTVYYAEQPPQSLFPPALKSHFWKKNQ